MTRYLHTNNASSNLRTAINAAATTLQVGVGHGTLFPNPTTGEGFFVTVEDRRIGRIEIMLCTSRVGDTLTITRGQQGTVPQSFPIGVNVANRVTAQILNEFVDGTIGIIDVARLPMIPNENIISMDAAKLTGTINVNRLPDIPPERLTNVPAPSLTGLINEARLPTPIPATHLPAIPSSLLTSVPAASLTGTIATARLPTIPSSLLTSVPAASLTGTIASARLGGSYTDVTALTASSNIQANRFLTSGGSGSAPAYSFDDSIDSGMGHSNTSTIGVYIANDGAGRLYINNTKVQAVGGTVFTGPGSGLTGLDATELTGNISIARIESALHATSGSAGVYSCRAWARVNVSGSSVSLVGSGNISSISYQGSNQVRVNFSTDMANANYGFTLACDDTSNRVVAVTSSYIQVALNDATTFSIAIFQ